MNLYYHHFIQTMKFVIPRILNDGSLNPFFFFFFPFKVRIILLKRDHVMKKDIKQPKELQMGKNIYI